MNWPRFKTKISLRVSLSQRRWLYGPYDMDNIDNIEHMVSNILIIPIDISWNFHQLNIFYAELPSFS